MTKKQCITRTHNLRQAWRGITVVHDGNPLNAASSLKCKCCKLWILWDKPGLGFLPLGSCAFLAEYLLTSTIRYSFPMQALVEPIPGSNALETFCRSKWNLLHFACACLPSVFLFLLFPRSEDRLYRMQDGPQRVFTGELRSILETIAKTGKYWHNWSQLKSLICFRLAQVMQEYHASTMHVDDSATDLVHGEQFTDVLDRLLQGLDSFTEGAPFTCQRLCELLLNPKDTYVNLDKLSLAFEKLLLVTSTEPASTDPYPLTPQPPPKPKEVLAKEQVADEILPDALPVNGSHEPNGSHKDVQDEEMVDVGIVDRPVEVAVPNQPAVSEGFTVPNDTPEKLGSEDAANGHIGVSGDESGDTTLEDTKPE